MENAKIQMEWDFLADFQTLCTLVVPSSFFPRAKMQYVLTSYDKIGFECQIRLSSQLLLDNGDLFYSPPLKVNPRS